MIFVTLFGICLALENGTQNSTEKTYKQWYESKISSNYYIINIYGPINNRFI